MPVDVADGIDVVSGVSAGDVSSGTADAASSLAASVQHPIATVTAAAKSSDAPPQPRPVTVDLITQDASQLSCTDSNDDACELACGRVLEETVGEEKGDLVGRPVGEGVAGNGPRESVSLRFWAGNVGCVCASAAADRETWRISARWMMRVIEGVRVCIPFPAPTEESMDVSNRKLDFVLAACEGLSV